MTTELEIVNQMLTVTGQDNVLSLDTQNPTVVQAYNSFKSANKDFQSPGWWFNREINLKLSAQTNGEVNVPADTLAFTARTQPHQSGVHQNYPLYQGNRYLTRGSRVYDSVEHTYNIGRDLYADVIVLLPVEYLPETAASYLKHFCKKMFFNDDDGDQVKLREIKEDVALAWHNLYSRELKEQANNALNSPAALQLRYRIGQYGTTTNPAYPGGVRRVG